MKYWEKNQSIAIEPRGPGRLLQANQQDQGQPYRLPLTRSPPR